MAFQPAPNCAESAIQYALPGAPGVNVLNWLFAGPYDQEAIDALAVAVDGVISELIAPYLQSGTTYVGTTVRGLATPIDLEATEVTVTPGSGSGSSIPNNVSYVTSLRTGFTGRSARGRVYHMPPPASFFVGPNTISTIYAEAQITILEALRDAGAAEFWTLVVLSRQQNGVVLSEAVPRAVTDIVSRNARTDSQRGRLPKGAS